MKYRCFKIKQFGAGVPLDMSNNSGYQFTYKINGTYTLSEAWSGVNWADLMAAFGTNFYDRSIRTIIGTMLWTKYIDLS